MAAGRKTGGRKRGTPNRVGADLREAAAAYTADALAVLVEIATKGESEAARVTAATAILDRAHGKPGQAVELTGCDGGPIETTTVTDLDRAKALHAFISRLKAAGHATPGASHA